MKNFVAAAALAAGLFGASALPSLAAVSNPTLPGVTNVGVVSLADGSFTGTSPTGTGQGNNFDYFAFQIPYFGSFTVNASATVSQQALKITGLDFFSDIGTATTPGTILPPPGKDGSSTGNGKYFVTETFTFAPGTYYVGVATNAVTGSPLSSYGYTGVLSVASVPLPNSVAMFGVALAGLGIVGAARKGRKASAAA